MRTIQGADITARIKNAIWNDIFDQYGIEVSERIVTGYYEAYGILLEDVEMNGDTRTEIMAAWGDYRTWADKKLAGSHFQSTKDARRFFEQEWKPILLGGKACIMRTNRELNSNLECYSKQDWKEMFNTKTVMKGGLKSAALWWMNNTDYIPTVFNPDPNYHSSDKEYNLFQGFKYKAESNGKSERYIRLIKDGICRGDEDHFNYLMDWMAQAIQQPHRRDKVGIAVAIKGDAGVGKTTFAKVFSELFGGTAYTLDNIDNITGQFNGSLFEKILIIGEESVWGGDKKQYSILKRLITDDTLNISFKFKEIFPTRNYLRFIFLTNSDWSAPNEVGDRRLFVLCADDVFKLKTDFFDQLWQDMRSGGFEDLLYILMNRDISNRDFQKDFPVTEWALENVERSLSSVGLLITKWLEYGISISAGSRDGCDLFEWGAEVPKELVYDEYCRFSKELGKHLSPDATFGRELKRVLPSLTVERREMNGRKVSFYRFPSYEIAREEFESYKLWKNRRES